MSSTVVLPVVIGLLVAIGLYLMTSRHLSRVIVGVIVTGNGINLLVLSAAGEVGSPPLTDGGLGEGFSDPLPQAMVLTAIVITFAITAFLLAVVYRHARLTGDDVIEDDDDDRRVRGDDDL